MRHRPWKKTRFQTTTLLAIVVLLIILFSLVGYYFILPDLERARQREQVLADLATNGERWRETEPVAYRYVVERDCYCPEEETSPYVVTIDRGKTTVRYIANAASVPPAVVRLEELFALATEAASASRQVDVVFAAGLGYPARVRIDDLEGGRGSVESYSIRDFEVIAYD